MKYKDMKTNRDDGREEPPGKQQRASPGRGHPGPLFAIKSRVVFSASEDPWLRPWPPGTMGEIVSTGPGSSINLLADFTAMNDR